VQSVLSVGNYFFRKVYLIVVLERGPQKVRVVRVVIT